MTALTMEQRRQDFEAMLKRADLARTTMPQCREALTETGGPLALIARDVAELCAAWAESAYRARTHKPSDQAQARARIVAARCLQAITELEDSQGIPLDDLLKAVVGDAADIFAAGPDNALDLGVDPRLRAQFLLRSLGDLAACWPAVDDRPSPFGTDTYDQQFTALFGLLFESICAALAAERGLWQEEES